MARRKFQIGDHVRVKQDAQRHHRLRTGIVTKLGFGEYEVSFDDDHEPAYADVASMRLEHEHASPLPQNRCPICDSADVQTVMRRPYESTKGVTWHECLTCLRIWHRDEQLRSEVPDR